MNYDGRNYHSSCSFSHNLADFSGNAIFTDNVYITEKIEIWRKTSILWALRLESNQTFCQTYKNKLHNLYIIQHITSFVGLWCSG